MAAVCPEKSLSETFEVQSFKKSKQQLIPFAKLSKKERIGKENRQKSLSLTRSHQKPGYGAKCEILTHRSAGNEWLILQFRRVPF